LASLGRPLSESRSDRVLYARYLVARPSAGSGKGKDTQDAPLAPKIGWTVSWPPCALPSEPGEPRGRTWCSWHVLVVLILKSGSGKGRVNPVIAPLDRASSTGPPFWTRGWLSLPTCTAYFSKCDSWIKHVLRDVVRYLWRCGFSDSVRNPGIPTNPHTSRSPPLLRIPAP
jgi:hypothetical protein